MQLTTGQFSPKPIKGNAFMDVIILTRERKRENYFKKKHEKTPIGNSAFCDERFHIRFCVIFTVCVFMHRFKSTTRF